MMAGAGTGKTPGKYGEAHYIAVSPRDEVFVADTLNWRVQKYVKRYFRCGASAMASASSPAMTAVHSRA